MDGQTEKNLQNNKLFASDSILTRVKKQMKSRFSRTHHFFTSSFFYMRAPPKNPLKCYNSL